ncbi:MAG: GYD domain-containing protein [Gemmatimonadota bacterium]|nr:MAG: GYD domain-containing protein [Gemmatimonadota bacterium]
MPTYITLASWTDQGIRNVKESPARLDAVKEMFRSTGAELKQFYLVTGQHDMVVVSEAPDDTTIAKVALAIGAQGAVRTMTLRAFTEDEYRKIIADLP